MEQNLVFILLEERKNAFYGIRNKLEGHLKILPLPLRERAGITSGKTAGQLWPVVDALEGSKANKNQNKK